MFEISPDSRVTARSEATKQSPATTVIRRGLLRLLAQARNDMMFYVTLFFTFCHSEQREESYEMLRLTPQHDKYEAHSATYYRRSERSEESHEMLRLTSQRDRKECVRWRSRLLPSRCHHQRLTGRFALQMMLFKQPQRLLHQVRENCSARAAGA